MRLALVARDRLLDQWLAVCRPLERQLTVAWLLDPAQEVNEDIMPSRLRWAQRLVLEALGVMEGQTDEQNGDT